MRQVRRRRGGRGRGHRLPARLAADAGRLPAAGDRPRRPRPAPRAVLPLGDNQYGGGSLWSYRASYDRTWGRFIGRAYPTPGNHEYKTSGAAGYYRYFGSRAAAPVKP